MYTVLDVVGNAETHAEAAAFEDRMRYAKFVEAAEHYAAAHDLIVGASSATRLLLGDPTGSGVPPPIGFDSFRYEFFSSAAPTHAKALADALYEVDPTGLGRYVTVRSKVPGNLLAVDVDGRDMFALMALHVRRGVRMADVMIPSRRPAQFAKDAAGRPLQLLCAGPEVQLMEICAALCCPARAPDWGELLTAEAGTREIFKREIGPKLAGVVGGAPDREYVGAGEYGRGGARARLYSLMLSWAAGPSRALIGSVAVAALAGTPPRRGPASHLQVVSASRLETEAAELTALAQRAAVEIQWTISDPNIPTAPRLRRMSVHAVIDGARELMLDVFNAAEYELVPYVLISSPIAIGGRRGQQHDNAPPPWPTGLKVGTPFVLMRFRLADMWTMQVLLKMNVVDAKFTKAVLNAMLSDYTAAAAVYEAKLARVPTEPAVVEQLLPIENYVGRFEEADIALKRAVQNAADVKFFAPYMPVMGRARGLAARLLTADESNEDNRVWHDELP